MKTGYQKDLYSITMGGVRSQIRLYYNTKTDLISIYTMFSRNQYEKLPLNRDCPSFLGITVGEKVLGKVFKHVKLMPPNNSGFDFICGKGYMVDGKASCRCVSEKHSDCWRFSIRKNTTPDQFLCLAFDNRKSLKPEHVWFIPGHVVNMKMNLTISESKIEKWAKYELNNLDSIIECCDTIKL